MFSLKRASDDSISLKMLFPITAGATGTTAAPAGTTAAAAGTTGTSGVGSLLDNFVNKLKIILYLSLSSIVLPLVIL